MSSLQIAKFIKVFSPTKLLLFRVVKEHKHMRLVNRFSFQLTINYVVPEPQGKEERSLVKPDELVTTEIDTELQLQTVAIIMVNSVINRNACLLNINNQADA